jgi:hypothetical protein
MMKTKTKTMVATVLAGLLGLLAGCAGTGGGGNSGSGSSSGGSGVTVFGTIDAGVSGYRNQSK